MTLRQFLSHPWVRQEIKTCCVWSVMFALGLYGFGLVTPDDHPSSNYNQEQRP